MKNKLFIGIFTFLFSLSVSAMDISGAKASGLVGEKPDGYIGATGSANAQIKQLVDTINSKRKAAYQTLAKKQKLSLGQIEKISGERNMKKTKKGHFIFKGGSWTKK